MTGAPYYEPSPRARRLIVCGGREFSDYDFLEKTLDRLTRDWPDVVIYHGGNKNRIAWNKIIGADWLASVWARKRRKTQIVFHADWKKHKKAAGPIRNREMAMAVGKGGYLVSFWDGRSKGTEDIIEQAEKVGIKCKVFVKEY